MLSVFQKRFKNVFCRFVRVSVVSLRGPFRFSLLFGPLVGFCFRRLFFLLDIPKRCHSHLDICSSMTSAFSIFLTALSACKTGVSSSETINLPSETALGSRKCCLRMALLLWRQHKTIRREFSTRDNAL